LRILPVEELATWRSDLEQINELAFDKTGLGASEDLFTKMKLYTGPAPIAKRRAPKNTT
jgi:hypothetical protein